jgi:hypothetical protein
VGRQKNFTGQNFWARDMPLPIYFLGGFPAILPGNLMAVGYLVLEVGGTL